MYRSSKFKPNIDSPNFVDNLSPFIPKNLRALLSAKSGNAIAEQSSLSVQTKKNFKGTIVKGTSATRTTKYLSPSNIKLDEPLTQGSLINLTNVRTSKSPIQYNKNNENERKKNVQLFPLKPMTAYPTESSGEENKNVREFRIKTMIPRNIQQKQNNRVNRSVSLSYNNIPEVTKIKMDTSVEEYMDIRFNDYVNKETEMNSFYQNMVTGSRSSLPLLIMHFEGLLGTCSYYPLKEGGPPMKQCQFMKEYSTNIVLRSGMKKEIRSLVKDFIVVLVFPSSADRYKNAMKFILKNNFNIDGAYYINKESRESKSNEYLMSYNMIIEDYKLKPIHKTIIFKTIDLSETQLKIHYHDYEKNNNLFYFNTKIDKACFKKLFPKIGIRIEKIRVCLFGNFLLDERNEKSPLSCIHPKYQFKNLVDIANKIFKEELSDVTQQHIAEMEDESPTEKHSFFADSIHIIKSNTHIVDPNIEISSSNENNQEVYKTPRKEEHRNKFVPIDFKEILPNIEDHFMRNKFLENAQRIKMKNVNLGYKGFFLDINALKSRIVEDILVQAKAKGITKNVMGYFVVGDSFMRNNDIMKIYEKNEFYSNSRHKENLIEITRAKENEYHWNMNSNDGLSSTKSSVDVNHNCALSSNSNDTSHSKESSKHTRKNLYADKFEMNMVKKYLKSFLICYDE